MTEKETWDVKASDMRKVGVNKGVGDRFKWKCKPIGWPSPNIWERSRRRRK